MTHPRRINTLVMLAAFAVLALATGVRSQAVVVDRTVATVSDGVRTELITQSDLLWQLALQPGTPIEPPRPEDMKEALQRQIEQRIFALEALRIPRAAASEKDVADEIAQLLKFFPSTADFERRLRAVGFESVRDDNFEAIIAQRIAIERYLDFRFRSFVVITAEDEAAYYRDTWVPEFRRRNPNAIVPELTRVRADVVAGLTEQRVARGMEQFVEEAKRRVTVTILHEV